MLLAVRYSSLNSIDLKEQSEQALHCLPSCPVNCSPQNDEWTDPV